MTSLCQHTTLHCCTCVPAFWLCYALVVVPAVCIWDILCVQQEGVQRPKFGRPCTAETADIFICSSGCCYSGLDSFDEHTGNMDWTQNLTQNLTNICPYVTSASKGGSRLTLFCIAEGRSPLCNISHVTMMLNLLLSCSSKVSGCFPRSADSHTSPSVRRHAFAADGASTCCRCCQVSSRPRRVCRVLAAAGCCCCKCCVECPQTNLCIFPCCHTQQPLCGGATEAVH